MQRSTSKGVPKELEEPDRARIMRSPGGRARLGRGHARAYHRGSGGGEAGCGGGGCVRQEVGE
jgi:hypothetical protein